MIVMQGNTCSGADRSWGQLGHFAPSSQLAPSYRGPPSCKKTPKVEKYQIMILPATYCNQFQKNPVHTMKKEFR